MWRGMDFITRYSLKGLNRSQLGAEVEAVVKAPAEFVRDPLRSEFSQAALRSPRVLRERFAPWRKWGDGLEPEAVNQMARACQVPVAVAGALMPDAHVGYGLPIGGVLATENAVIPYAVGVDIARRMKLTVLDWPFRDLDRRRDRLVRAIAEETRFGIGAHFKERRQHEVLDADWTVGPITKNQKDRARAQLGTSGSGNHFVEFGVLTSETELQAADGRPALPAGQYVALLSHSGTRGIGAAVCDYYSKRALERQAELPKELKNPAWLPLDSAEGAEYWAAIELMGRYTAANHGLIHQHIETHLGVGVLLDVENHHNFAWKERHLIGGVEREVVVHRKGATPAHAGVLGVIPASMATPGFVVRGKGGVDSLGSASHGAGRVMSRTKALETFEWQKVNRVLMSGMCI